MSKDEAKTFVVIDTNVFVRDTRLLRIKAGPPFLHYLARKPWTLFVPAVLRREYLEQAVVFVGEQINSIRRAFDDIQKVIGERDDYRVPSEEDAMEAADLRLKALESVIATDEMTDALLAAAGRRTIEKRRPTSKSDHGYKDCVIWESIIRLPAGSKVHLVTRDKAAFFEGARLHPSLATEASDKQLHVAIHNELEAVLSLLVEGEAPLSARLLAEALDLVTVGRKAKLAAQWALNEVPGPGVTFEVTPYSTEQFNRVYATFDQRCYAGRAVLNGQEYFDTSVVLSGSCDWFEDQRRIENLQIESEKLLTSDGVEIGENRTIYASGTAAIGRSTIRHRVREPLIPKAGQS